MYVLDHFQVAYVLYQLLIPTFHWTTFPLRSWRSRSFSKIIPNRSRSVDSHTIWGLHASSTLPLRFHYASITLLLRCCRAAHDSAALSLRFCYDPATTMKTRLRSVYANGDAATRLLRHRRRSYVFVALLCHFYIKSEVYSSGNKNWPV